MSSDEESRNHSQRVGVAHGVVVGNKIQDFQTLVLPPVPRPPNAQQQHTHSPDLSRRPVTSSSRGQHSSEPYPKPSNKGGVRGRVTVVCAECKRLKLRCSRDRPCTSCIKRACTDRCRYRNDEQPLPSHPVGEHRSIIPSANQGDNAYRLVSTNCVQCSSANTKCDRREPCSQCSKQQLDCHYPGLQPLTSPTDPTVLHALARLARIESRLGEINAPECDQCLELNLKCDGNARNPCSWCIKRYSGGGAVAGQQEAGLNLPPIQHQHGAPACTYSSYAEQAQRQGMHSPQSSLHAISGNASRDRSPYALRISSPPPPSSSHSNTSAGAELLARIQTAENVTNNYARTHNHSFSHGHSLSHGSATSMASGGYGPSYPSASTLTPITPSHPSSLHHYVTSPGTGGHGHQHSHSHSHSQSHSHHSYQSDGHHQRTSSKHSPPQHLLPPHEQPPYHPQQQDHRQETHRPRGPSLSNSSVHLPRPQNSTTPTGFGSNNVSKHSKIPTPPGSSSSGAAPQSAGTKLPEISNILTLLSPAPASSNSDKQSPLPFPTPVSGVVGSGLGNLSLGGGSTIQHLQSDIRGSSSSRHGYSGSEGGRRGSLSDRRTELPSPSRSSSTTPPHHSSGSRPSSSEARHPVMIDGVSKPEPYIPQHPRRASGASIDISSTRPRENHNDKHAPYLHSRTSSTVQGSNFMKKEDDDDEMAEVDEIENDMDP